MADSGHSSSSRPPSNFDPDTPRTGLAKLIPRRPRVTWVVGIVFAFVFATLVTPVITAERWLGSLDVTEVVKDQPAPVTVRVPAFAGLETVDNHLSGGGVVLARGEIASQDDAALAEAIAAATPRGLLPYIAFFVLLLVFVTVFTHHMRRSNLGRLVRVQLVSLTSIALVAVAAKVVLLGTALSVLVVPVALLAMVPTMVLDRTTGLATGVLAALVVSLLGPFDLGVAILMLVQAATAGLVVAERPKQRWKSALFAGVVTTLFTVATYVLITYLTTGKMPAIGDPLRSPWLAAAVGPMIAMLLTVPLIPLYQLLVGEITQGKLVELEDLSNPLLKQIAERSPGTWQHSLMMANMAEIAANTIGANGRLVRVGAYYHDLGKSLQPKYFIENLEPGETSPHDQLPPEVSCSAIFEHVTEGIVCARKAGLHERIVDFMHMHHGDGVLEYFWGKCREQGNPRNMSIEEFRYPGHPPQSRETAILAICDAVEAASRTLKKPEPAAIQSLVQRIVYGKLHLGQLDESGLSMSDLRRISDSLRETIRHANHGRIEYPWQKVAQDASTSQSTTNKPTQSTEPRLDSLDRKPNNRQTGMTAAMSGAIELGVADRKSNPKWPEGSGDVNPGRAALGIADTSDLRRDDELAILETAPAVPRHEPPSASREGEWPKLTESAVARIDDYEHERSRTFSAPIAPPILVAPASIPDEVPAGALPPPPADGRISPSTFAAVTPPVARKRAATLPPTPKAHPPIVSPPPRLSSGPPSAQTLSGGPVPHALPATPSGPTAVPRANLPATPSGPTAVPRANLPATPSGPTAVPRANASGTSGPHTIPRTPTTLAGASAPGATTLSGGGSPARPPAEPVGMATLQGPNAPARLPATPNPAQSSASSTPSVGVGPGASAAPHRPSSPSANPPRTAGPPARVDRENAITNPPPLRRSGLGNDPPTLRNPPLEATRLPGVILGVDEDRRTTSPLLPVQQPPVTYVGHVGPFESPFDSDDAARTEPTMPAFELPLRAPPTNPPPHQDWKTSLAARIDAKLDGDEWSTETPVVPPTKAELRALLGAPDPTRKLSLDELERLHRAVDETPSEPEVLLRRPGSKTAEVDAEQIEAAIELAPPARNRPPTAIGVAKPKKPE